MRAEKLAEINSDSVGRGNMLRSVDEGFRETAARDPKASAETEKAEFFASVPGRRTQRPERDQISRQIDEEHEAAHRREMAQALGLLDYAHSQELPVLEGHVRECEQPPTAAEMYEAAVSGAGTADRPLTLALLEQITRRDTREELSPMPPSVALPLYRGAISGNGITPDAVVRRAVLIQEIERRSTWAYDAKGPNAATEHAASLELAKLIAETKASRVPNELKAAIDAAREARRFADRLRAVHKLHPATPAELFGDGAVSDRYKEHPAIQRAMKRRDEGR